MGPFEESGYDPGPRVSIYLVDDLPEEPANQQEDTRECRIVRGSRPATGQPPTQSEYMVHAENTAFG